MKGERDGEFIRHWGIVKSTRRRFYLSGSCIWFHGDYYLLYVRISMIMHGNEAEGWIG